MVIEITNLSSTATRFIQFLQSERTEVSFFILMLYISSGGGLLYFTVTLRVVDS
jgi:hypothetical protein